MKKFLIRLAASAALAAAALHAQAAVVTGTLNGWQESSYNTQIGDGSNFIKIHWSWATSHYGYFYSVDFGGDFQVAVATGVTDIKQITDASLFNYGSYATSALGDAEVNSGVGSFVVWKSTDQRYGVLRVDHIHDYKLDGTWWYQGDGSGNFNTQGNPVPEPGSLALGLLALGLLPLGTRRARSAVR